MRYGIANRQRAGSNMAVSSGHAVSHSQQPQQALPPSPYRPTQEKGIKITIGPHDGVHVRNWFTFPVTPESIPVAGGANWVSRYTLEGGEMVGFGGRNLDTISFAGRLEPPNYYVIGGVTSIPGIEGQALNVDLLENLQNAALISGGEPLGFSGEDVRVVMQDGAYAGQNYLEAQAFVDLLDAAQKDGEVMRLQIGDNFGWNHTAFIESFCIEPTQLITTRRGHIPIREVRVGDEVLTHKGRWRRVVDTGMRPYSGPLIGLCAANRANQVAWVTENHPVWVQRPAMYRYYDGPTAKGGRPGKVRWRKSKLWKPVDPEWVDAAHLEAANRVLIPSMPLSKLRPVLRMCTDNAVSLPDGRLVDRSKRWGGQPNPRGYSVPPEVEVTPDLATLLGLYLAKGSVSGSSIAFAFHREETELHQVVVEGMKRHFGLDGFPWQRQSKDGVQKGYACRVLANTLVAEFGKGAKNKHVSTWLVDAPPEIGSSLLRGMFLGDGGRQEGGWTLTTISRAMAYQAADMLQAIGLPASIGLYDEDAKTHTNPVYLVRINKSPATDRFMAGEFASIDEDHQERWECLREPQVRWYEGAVYNLTVEGDNSFVVEGIAVHNSYKYEDPDPDVILYEITFKQFRELKPMSASTEPSKKREKPRDTNYTTHTGDTLHSIAVREWGEGSKWRSILNLNRQVIAALWWYPSSPGENSADWKNRGSVGPKIPTMQGFQIASKVSGDNGDWIAPDLPFRADVELRIAPRTTGQHPKSAKQTHPKGG